MPSALRQIVTLELAAEAAAGAEAALAVGEMP
jgi:hypothetical protein